MVTDRLIGQDLARYHIEAVLGRGGMGVVYRATDTRLGRTVALKVLSDERSADPDFRDRFIRESRLLASIDHPNIVPIYEADEADGQLYIAMRYVPGPELRVIIADEAPMDAGKTVAIIGQVADALDAAHAAGLIHRDVKPGNILVMPGATSALAGHAYLTDFGLTKATGSDTGLTKIGQFVGTPGYVAPEQIEGRGVDHRVDVYALGCILYNCLSGDVPYPRDSTVASLWAHLKEPPPRLSEHRKGLPKGLDAVITRALAKSPDDRWQTCGSLAQAARTAIEPTRRRRAAGAGAAIGAVGAVAGVGGAAGAEPGLAAETAIDSNPVLADAAVVEAAASATVIESLPDAAPAEATVVEPTVVEPTASPPVGMLAAATMIESQDAMVPRAPATLVDSHATEAPVAATAALANTGTPGVGTTAPADAPTLTATAVGAATAPVTPTRPHAGSAMAGRERPIAAVLVAALLIGVGVFGVNAIGGGTAGSSPTPTSSTAVVPSADPDMYTALAGDTFGTIAAKFGVTIDRLRAANPGLSGAIVVGQSVVIPSPSSPQPSVAPPSMSVAPSTSQPPPSASPLPTSTATPKPTATPTKATTPGSTTAKDTKGPTGATVRISSGALTTSRKVTITVPNRPSDPSGISAMAVSNTSKRPAQRKYDTSFSWTLADGKAGSRTVYMWFKDSKGNWSSASKDSITFDHKPNAHGYTWDFPNDAYWCSRAWVDLQIPGYAASDSDGNGTLTVVDAWHGSQHYPVIAGTQVRVGVATPPFGRTHYSFDFKVKDNHGVTDTGTAHFYYGPC